MLTGKDKVIDFIKFNDCKFWRLRRTDAGPFLFTCTNSEYTIDDSIRRLTDALNYLDSGNYFIECGTSSDDKRGWNKSPFRLTDANGFNPYPQVAGIGSITPDTIQEKINEALEKERNNRKIEELTEKLKISEQEKRELEQERDSLFLRLGKRIEPYVGSIIEALGIKAQPVLQPATRITGIEKTEKVETMEEQKIENTQERLEKAFETWSNYEKDPVTLIEKIVELAETNPTVYKKAKEILMNPTVLNLLS